MYNQPEWYTDLLDYINLFFTFFFVGEFMLKFGAYRFKNYFSDPWNGFDFFIVVGSLIDLGFAQLAPDSEVNQLMSKCQCQCQCQMSMSMSKCDFKKNVNR